MALKIIAGDVTIGVRGMMLFPIFFALQTGGAGVSAARWKRMAVPDSEADFLAWGNR